MKPQIIKELLMPQVKTVAANAKSFCVDVKRLLKKQKTCYGKSYYRNHSYGKVNF
ncbi:MAG: hypothetical protein K6G24_13845 [Lachnospiraceae bacterium]|nr:hypothetical protein [Lachnospiraceae bacterium]